MRTICEILVAALGVGILSMGRSARTIARSRASRGGFEILILGGAGFIGPHFVGYAMQRGHKITLFNAGRTNTHLFPEVEKLVGDRNDNLSALEGRHLGIHLSR